MKRQSKGEGALYTKVRTRVFDMNSSDIFTPLDLTEEQAAVRQTVQAFCKNHLQSAAAAIDENQQIPKEIWNALAQAQLLGVPFPETYGGMGLNVLCGATVVEELARVCASTALSVAAHVSLGTSPINKFGSDAQKKRF